MSMSTGSRTAGPVAEAKVAAKADVSERAAAAFGLSAAVTVLFNTLLAWIKDAYAPLNSFMASLTGHHWRTHGIVDVLLFLILGWLFLSRGGAPHLTDRLIVGLAAASVIAGAGLAGWFFLV
jgi:hypothetical protein